MCLCFSSTKPQTILDDRFQGRLLLHGVWAHVKQFSHKQSYSMRHKERRSSEVKSCSLQKLYFKSSSTAELRIYFKSQREKTFMVFDCITHIWLSIKLKANMLHAKFKRRCGHDKKRKDKAKVAINSYRLGNFAKKKKKKRMGSIR